MSKKKNVLIISILCAAFVAYSDGVKNQAQEINEDVLIDDNDTDILKAAKASPVDSFKVNKARDTVKSKELINENDKAAVSNSNPAEASIKADTSKMSITKDTVKSDANVKVKEIDEELILEGGAEDLLGDKSIKSVDTLSKTGQINSVIPKVQTQSVSSENIVSGKDSLINSISDVKTIEVSAKKVEAKTVKVENTNSINFAKNLQNYRSPKVAMVLSAILPGAGEVYARNGIRAAIFGALEIGIIGAGFAYQAKGAREIDEAYSFADQHFNEQKFRRYYNAILKEFKQNIVDSTIFQYAEDNPKDFSKKSKNYYDRIGNQAEPYVQGWDDVAPVPYDTTNNDNWRTDISDDNYHQVIDTGANGMDSSYFIFQGKDSNYVAYGYSKNQQAFDSKMSKGNSSYKISKNIFTLLIVNHILSAIDAGICAKAYNDKQLGKQSLWQRISIQDVAVNTGSGIITGYAFQLRF